MILLGFVKGFELSPYAENRQGKASLIPSPLRSWPHRIKITDVSIVERIPLERGFSSGDNQQGNHSLFYSPRLTKQKLNNANNRII